MKFAYQLSEVDETPEIDSKRGLQILHPSLSAVIFVALYYLGGLLGDFCSFKPNDYHSFWPAGGLCLAALLIYPRPVWPVFFVSTLAGSLLVETFVHGHGILIGVVFGVACFLQGASAAWIIMLVTRSNFMLGRVRHVAMLAMVAPVASLISVTIGMTSVRLVMGWSVGMLWCVDWWLADVVGILVVTPAVLAWTNRLGRRQPVNWREIAEAVLLFSTLIVASDLVFAPAQEG